MTTKSLGEAIHAKPFHPFSLNLADGRQPAVPHPDFIAYVPGGRTAVVLREDESYEVVDLLLVTSLNVPPPAASAAPGGGPR